MKKMDDETCWSGYDGGLGGDGGGRGGCRGMGEVGGFGMRPVGWEVVAGRNVIEIKWDFLKIQNLAKKCSREASTTR